MAISATVGIDWTQEAFYSEKHMSG
jgi:hypothetical protein